MLDTDTVSFAIRGKGKVAERIRRFPRSDLCISSISLAELRFGAESVNSSSLLKLISTFTEDLQVVAFDQGAADRFGSIAASLQRRGEPIGTFDNLIAAHALSLGLTLVTNNTKHFERVPGLDLENWA